MLYLWPSSGAPPGFGVITAPTFKGVNISIKNGVRWGMDSGLFGGSFSMEEYLWFIGRHKQYRKTCLFVTVPDSLGNSIETLHLWRNHVRFFEGWPLAFVAQDGQENLPLPTDYHALFVGGTTEWKMSTAADDLIRKAKGDGKWVHVGRVNSIKRYRHFQLVGADSCDGTLPILRPNNARRLLTRAIKQPPLLEIT